MHPTRTPVILLAEDSVDDEFFFRWALEQGEIASEVVHASDGVEAVRKLQASRADDGRRLPGCPDIVFLDLKMPVASGFDVLSWLRDHPFQPPLDIAVLSGSDRDADVALAKSLGASVFYLKPLSPARLQKHLRGWLDQASLATPSSG